MYNQYAPIMAELQRKLHQGSSLFYSWHGGGGASFWNLLAYQASSPLTVLLLFLFPESLLLEAIMLSLFIKVGLAGAAMYYCLGILFPATQPSAVQHQEEYDFAHTSNHATNFARVVLGCLYALSAYTLAYYWNLMWFDAVALLPLCVAGMARIINQGRPFLYLVALALTILCNYYIAAMECIFLVLMYLVLYFQERRISGVVGFLKTSGRMLVYSVLAACFAAPVLLPVFFSTLRVGDFTSLSHMEAVPFAHFSLLELLVQLFPNVRPTKFTGYPNIYCGLSVVVLVLTFFCNGKITVRKRVVFGCLLVVLLASVKIPALDLVWNFFHQPNGIPYRYSYVVSFALVLMAYQGLLNVSHIQRRVLMGVFAVVAVVCMAALVLGLDYQLYNRAAFLVVTSILLVLYAVLFFMYNHRSLSTPLFVKLLGSAALLELVFVAGSYIYYINTDDHKTLLDDSDTIAALVQEAQEEAQGFSRIEIAEASNRNAPYVVPYQGLSMYASSVDSGTTSFMHNLGFDTDAAGNQYTYTLLGQREHALLGLNYVIGKDIHTDIGLEPVATRGTYTLYRTTQKASIGYWMPADVLDMHDPGDAEPLLNYVDAYLSTGQSFSDGRGVLQVEEMTDGRMRATIQADEDGALFTSIPYDAGWRVTVDGRPCDTIPIADAFVGIVLSAGVHTVEMYFIPYGLQTGSFLNLGALLIAAILWLRRR